MYSSPYDEGQHHTSVHSTYIYLYRLDGKKLPLDPSFTTYLPLISMEKTSVRPSVLIYINACFKVVH